MCLRNTDIPSVICGSIWMYLASNHLVQMRVTHTHTCAYQPTACHLQLGKPDHVIRAVPLRLHGASGVRYAGKCLPILLDTSVFKVPLWGSSSGHSCRHRPRRATAFLSETQVDEGCHAGTPVLQLTFSLRSESKQVTTCRR